MWKAHCKRAFTLVELLVSSFALIFLLATVFLLFGYSYRGFQLSTTRQDIQNQVLGARQWLERDFQLTHLGSVGVVPRKAMVEGTQQPRDSVCALSLSEWSDQSLYFATGLPRWNRYVLYLCSTDLEGSLTRQVLAPGDLTEPFRIRPYPKLFTVAEPESLPDADVVNSRRVASNVLSFECRVDQQEQSIVQTLKISLGGGPAGLGTRKIHEVLEASFRWEALNTTPRL